jgi:hypothetical protein
MTSVIRWQDASTIGKKGYPLRGNPLLLLKSFQMPQLQGKNTNMILPFLLLALSLSPQVAFACSQTCASDADCTGACAFCNTDFGICGDCCEFVDSITCPAACDWTGTECRNNSGTACGLALPETPKTFYRYFFVAALISIIGLALFRRIRKSRRPTDPPTA